MAGFGHFSARRANWHVLNILARPLFGYLQLAISLSHDSSESHESSESESVEALST